MILDKNIPCHHGEHKKFKIKCDFKCSEKCRIEYLKEVRCIFSDRENNNGKDICVFCSKKLKNTGRKNPNTKYHLDDEMMGFVDSEKKAYLLGWIASDGSISKTGMITISIKHTDSAILQSLLEYIYQDKEFRPELSFDSHGMVKLYIYSKMIMQDVCNHLKISPGKKSHTIQFPEFDNDEIGWAFLRGVFDGDGSVRNPKLNSTPSCKITSSSKLFRSQIIDFCKIPSNECNTDILWEGVNSIDFMGKLYDSAKIKLSRKYNDYMDWASWIPQLGGKGNSGWLDNSKMRWYKTRKDAVPLFKDRISDSGYDLTLIERKRELFSGSLIFFDTGIKVAMPHGFYLDMVPRSSLSKTGWMLANCVGVIDRAYRGNILVPLVKVIPDAPDIQLPLRAVQLIPRQAIHFQLEEVENELNLGSSNRQEKGFGSSGK